jgi:hypothetical protein
MASLKVTVTFVSTLTSCAPGSGENAATVGGSVSGATTVTATVVGKVCTFPPLSIARLRTVAGPTILGVQLKLQEIVPVAWA